MRTNAVLKVLEKRNFNPTLLASLTIEKDAVISIKNSFQVEVGPDYFNLIECTSVGFIYHYTGSELSELLTVLNNVCK
jgi:hypothetical protein